MEALTIKLYFYTWEIGGERYNSALYVTEQQRDAALKLVRTSSFLKCITFLPASTELFKSDLKAINDAFNK